jgi:hypothetical protein
LIDLSCKLATSSAFSKCGYVTERAEQCIGIGEIKQGLMNPEEKAQTAYEDEINLYDYWKVIVKRD